MDKVLNLYRVDVSSVEILILAFDMPQAREFAKIECFKHHISEASEVILMKQEAGVLVSRHRL